MPIIGGIVRGLGTIAKNMGSAERLALRGNIIKQAPKFTRDIGPTTHKPLLGIRRQQSLGSIPITSRPKFGENPLGWAGSHARTAIGDTAANLEEIVRNPIGGLTSQYRRAQYYTRKGQLYKHSPLGATANVAMTTLPGAGAIGMATAPRGKKLESGVTEGVKWGPLFPATMAYTTAKLPYDFAKFVT